MRAWYPETVKGAGLGVFAFILVSSSFPTHLALASSGPYFSMTLIAPTTDPARRQWAAIIQNSFAAANIDAKLIYTDFQTTIATLLGCSNGCPANDFAHGGWDAGFIENGATTVLPDFGTQNAIFYRSEGLSDVPPNGGNYYFFKNVTFNSLADDYNSNFNITQRLADARKMVLITAQERPGFIILYPYTFFVFSASLKPWGTTDATTSSTAGLDWQHWNTGSVTSIDIAVPPWAMTNSLPTEAQFPNSHYSRSLFGSTSAALEEADSRGTGVYFDALAKSITSSSDHKTWTILFKPHNFQDGVAVTADDYLFTEMSSLRSDVGYFGADSITKLLGVSEEFHFSNGTVDYVKMGAYSHRTPPANWTATSVWTSTGANSFTFSMPDSNILTDPIVTSFGAIPMHIYDGVPAKTWRSSFVSGFTGSTGALSNNRVTVTWDTTRYGGNGSYAWVYGPVSDGPYMYRGYDPASQTATLVKWSGYWNASGLQSMGEFGATRIHIQSIPTEKAAIGAFVSNQINYLDAFYSFSSQNITRLAGFGAAVVKSLDPGTGWQEMPLNDNAPIWGTGTGTPVGLSNPAKAAFAARMVRKALSYLIPRQQIINGLFSGRAAPGITQFYPTAGVIHPGDIYNGIKADPYDPAAAQEFLAAAGYGAIGAPLPHIVPSQTVAFQSIFLGQSFTLAGIYDPVSFGRELKYGGFAVVLEQSADNGSTWQPVADTYTNVGGYYTLTYTPTLDGTVEYRLFFSGVPVTYLNTQGYGSPASIEAITPPTSNVKSQWQNITATSYGPVSTVTIGIFGDSFKPLGSKAQLQAVADQITASLDNLSNSIARTLTTVNTEQAAVSAIVNQMVGSLNIANTSVFGSQGSINQARNIAYAAIAAATGLNLLAIGLALRKRRW